MSESFADAYAQRIVSVEKIIEDAKAKRVFIIVDAEDRESEGCIAIPAIYADNVVIAFMAREARGLVCLALTKERVNVLRLQPMTKEDASLRKAAFTVSIEAREGITTGISASDRAKTIAVAIDEFQGPDALVSPGHVFPLIARDGGVLHRAGHTEAAVDIARLAGLPLSGVICEILNDDGTMARLPDLIEFAGRHDLNICTISDLIAYRRRTERQLLPVVRRAFETVHGGMMDLHVFRDSIDGIEHVALVKPGKPGLPALVRMHQLDLAADVVGHVDARRDYVPSALRAIAAYDGVGVAVFLRDPDPAWISNRMAGVEASRARADALRDYGAGAQILKALGVSEMILLTSSTTKIAALEGYGLTITGRRKVSEMD